MMQGPPATPQTAELVSQPTASITAGTKPMMVCCPFIGPPQGTLVIGSMNVLPGKHCPRPLGCVAHTELKKGPTPFPNSRLVPMTSCGGTTPPPQAAGRYWATVDMFGKFTTPGSYTAQPAVFPTSERSEERRVGIECIRA